MSNELKIVGGINLIPEANFPASPTEGTLFSSDGSINAPGVYQYLSGIWVSLTGAPKLSPREIVLINSDFDQDIASITVDTTASSGGVTGIIHNTSTPLSGAGSLQVNATSSIPDDGYIYVDIPVTLSGPLQIDQVIECSFDFKLHQTTVLQTASSGAFGTGQVERIRADLVLSTDTDNQIGTLPGINVSTRTLAPGAGNFTIGPLEGHIKRVSLQFQSSGGATSYMLRIYAGQDHEVGGENGNELVFVIDNVKVISV